MTVSLIVPFHNAGKVLNSALSLCIEQKNKFPCELELIFINDGSTDDGLFNAARHEKMGVTVLTYSDEKGLGYAVRRGVLASRGDIIAISTVEMPYGIEILEEAIIALSEKGANVGCATRLGKGTKRVSIFNKISAFQTSLKVKDYLDLKVKDALSGFYIMDADVASRIFSHCVVDNEFYPLEFLGLAIKKEYIVTDIPVRSSSFMHIIRNASHKNKALINNLKKIKVRLKFDEFY